MEPQLGIFIGKVENGQVVLPPETRMPEGATVLAQPVADDPAKWLLQFADIIQDGPTDMAENHDHYAHGPSK